MFNCIRLARITSFDTYIASDDNVEVNNYNNIHDYLTSFCIYAGTMQEHHMMALVDPNVKVM